MTFSRLQSKRLPMHLTVNTHEGERKQSHIAKEQVSLAIIIMFNISPLSACFSWSHLCVPCSGVRRPSFDAPPTHWLKSINFNTKLIHYLSCNSFSKREARCQFVFFLRERVRLDRVFGDHRWLRVLKEDKHRQTLVIAVSAGIQHKYIKVHYPVNPLFGRVWSF